MMAEIQDIDVALQNLKSGEFVGISDDDGVIIAYVRLSRLSAVAAVFSSKETP